MCSKDGFMADSIQCSVRIASPWTGGSVMGLLDGKIAVITGASKGIGLVMSRQFAEEGASVVCSARTAGLVQEAAASITEVGGRAVAGRPDAASEEAAGRVRD